MDVALLDLLPNTITIQRPVDSGPDEHGNYDSTWTTVASVKASIQFFTGSEQRADRDVATRRWKVYVDGETDIRDTDRIIYDDITMEVVSVKIAWDFDGTENHRAITTVEVD